MSNFPEQIQKRLDAGMGCGSGISDGWMNLVVELDAKIAAIYPDYTIDQIKEKFGGLRYYIGKVPKEHFDEIHNLIHEAEAKSVKVCEECGEPGKRTTLDSGWCRTLCEQHEKEGNKQ